MSDGRFHDRVVVVTGAGQGLGREIAQHFRGEGARVVAADLREASFADDLIQPVVCDVANTASVEAMVGTTLDRFGAIDVLVNNAGISTVAPVVELPERDWDRVMDVCVKGTYLCCRAALPHLRERGGAIVNVASQAGKRGVPNIAHYCAAKAAVINFSRALALEVAPDVRVNAICPGIVETPLVAEQLASQARARGTSVEAVRDTWLGEIPLRRFQSSESVASAVMYLGSDDAADITGEALNVSGGMVMH